MIPLPGAKNRLKETAAAATAAAAVALTTENLRRLLRLSPLLSLAAAAAAAASTAAAAADPHQSIPFTRQQRSLPARRSLQLPAFFLHTVFSW